MSFEHGNVIYATIFGATLAFPSFGLAAIPGRSAQSAPVYAQASGTVNPSSVDDATLKRTAAAPEIPTVDEAGLPGFYISVWHGLWVPHGTPKDAIEKLTAAAQEALADPAVQKRLAELGQEIPPREQQTPEHLAAYHKAEIEKWWPLVKAAGIKGE